MKAPTVHVDLNDFAPGTPLLAVVGKVKGKGRYGQQPDSDTMNKTESLFANELRLRQTAGEVLGYVFGAMNFQLAKKCWFRPDFLVVLADHTLEFVDVKGSGPIADDSIVKIKMAARLFPFFGWAQEQRTKSGWKRTVYGGG